MTRVIRIDEDVWAWLQSQATPLIDTPNSVLRRVAELDTNDRSLDSVNAPSSKERKGAAVSIRSNSGKNLNRVWGVNARHALYHKEGTFYENLLDFPGALFDEHGYVVFPTSQDYEQSPYLRIGEKLNIRSGGIGAIPGYVWMAP